MSYFIFLACALSIFTPQITKTLALAPSFTPLWTQKLRNRAMGPNRPYSYEDPKKGDNHYRPAETH